MSGEKPSFLFIGNHPGNKKIIDAEINLGISQIFDARNRNYFILADSSDIISSQKISKVKVTAADQDIYDSATRCNMKSIA
jgi:hypothetical protein